MSSCGLHAMLCANFLSWPFINYINWAVFHVWAPNIPYHYATSSWPAWLDVIQHMFLQLWCIYENQWFHELDSCYSTVDLSFSFIVTLLVFVYKGSESKTCMCRVLSERMSCVSCYHSQSFDLTITLQMWPNITNIILVFWAQYIFLWHLDLFHAEACWWYVDVLLGTENFWVFLIHTFIWTFVLGGLVALVAANLVYKVMKCRDDSSLFGLIDPLMLWKLVIVLLDVMGTCVKQLTVLKCSMSLTSYRHVVFIWGSSAPHLEKWTWF